jgi:hypothetical protein
MYAFVGPAGPLGAQGVNPLPSTILMPKSPSSIRVKLNCLRDGNGQNNGHGTKMINR